MRKILPALFSVLSLAVISQSAAQTNSLGSSSQDNLNRVMIENFDFENIIPVMVRTGAKVERITLGNVQALGVEHRSGLRFIITPRACNPQTGNKCVGLSFMGIFNFNVDAVSANEYNKQAGIAMINTSGNQVFMYHYVIADYGIPSGNLAVTSDVFASNMIQLIEYQKKNLQVVSFDPLISEADEKSLAPHSGDNLPSADEIPSEYVNIAPIN